MTFSKGKFQCDTHTGRWPHVELCQPWEVSAGSGAAPGLESFKVDRKKAMENVLAGAALRWQELMNRMT